MITEIIAKLLEGKNLEFAEMQKTIELITDGKVSEVQIACFLTALRMKGETVEEISAAAQTLKNKCIPLNTQTADVIDIVGTGGDRTGTFNISTAAAFVAAGAGCKVAKHGNRSVSSKSGAADVLEAFGANINLTPSQSLAIFEKTGICFMFAQNHHPCMKYVANVRHEIRNRTLFNILGPLINPANAQMQLIGVYDGRLTEPLAKVLRNLNITNGMVVHGIDGLDEATITDSTMISEIKDNKISSYTIKPEDFSLKRAQLKDIQGGDSFCNAKIITKIFNSSDLGPKRDIVLLNAGLAIYIAKKASSVKQGIELAKASIDNGFALKTLNDFIALSKTFNKNGGKV